MKALLVSAAALLTLSACASEPAYAVRPGAPRAQFELPKPAYPVRQQDAQSAAPAPLQSQRAARTATPPPPEDDDTVVRPQPITEAPPPPDRAGPPLRGRQSPERTASVGRAPTLALEAPHTATVRPGETLFELAERTRTPVQSIVEANDLKPPYDVTPGDVLKIPAPVIYVVRAGDTFASVGRRFSIDPRSLASLNDLSYEKGPTPGQRLALPPGASERPAVTTRPALARRPKLAPGPSVEPQKSTPVEIGAASAPAGKGKFIWPVKGDILSGYGPKGPGQRNDGVNIAANAGDAVSAAAAGQVVYAGNSIPGFGNLVVVKHPDGWTSLYGNLAKITVRIRAEVEQGQELGVAGTSGNVDRPQVHFEVRYASSPQEKAAPVDPQSVLP